jgi:hypothetical protein
VIQSRLFADLAGAEGRGREVLDGVPVPRLTALEPLTPAEYARLISKGRLLYEHCMVEVSHACVMGFMDHELKKTKAARRVVLDLAGWMLTQRHALADLGEDVAARLAHTEYMIDLAVSLVHGLTRAEAQRLAAAIEP